MKELFYNRTEWKNSKGQLHRLNGPACEYADGSKYWCKEGKLHRLDGPAVEWASGSKCWYQEGKLHRLDGPACEWASGNKFWYKEGKCHRLDGPACEWASGSKSWYIEGEKFTEEEFFKKIQPESTLKVLSDGTKGWRNSEGLLHRIDGPAVEWADGSKSWYKEGKRHRLDGPAIEGADRFKSWYIEGKNFTEEEFLKKTQAESTSEVFHDGTKSWRNSKGQLHRIDGPAIEWSNGTFDWYQEGRLHRLDGPAIEYIDGSKGWYIEGKFMTAREYSRKANYCIRHMK